MSKDSHRVRCPVTGTVTTVPVPPVMKRPTASEWRYMTPHEVAERYDADQQPPGEELPVLLDVSMDADFSEGFQGTYTQIVEQECEKCGYDRATKTVETLPGIARYECNACQYVWG